jgi:methanogenic corrinoid protein MtbC1
MEFLESTNRRIIDPHAIGLQDHRQLNRDALAGLELQAVQRTDDDSLVSDPMLREQFERALLAGDEEQCRKVISSWYTLHGGMVSVADELLAPTFHAIGELWECGRADVYQERRGCEICIRLIHELRRLVSEPTPDAPLAMGGTSEHDHYQVANQLIEIIFREAGWRTISLGSAVPFSSMLSAIERYRPRVYWLSVSYIADEENFLKQFQDFATAIPTGTMLVVGGRCLTESLRRRMQFAAYCDSLRQLSMLARSLQAG